MHINFELLFSAGILPIRTVGEPGAHGATVAGTQGAGVGAPKEAVVAAMTAGLALALHILKDSILTIGLLSIIVAAGFMDVCTLLADGTIREAGAAPKVHIIIAPAHTHMPIRDLLEKINY